MSQPCRRFKRRLRTGSPLPSRLVGPTYSLNSARRPPGRFYFVVTFLPLGPCAKEDVASTTHVALRSYVGNPWNWSRHFQFRLSGSPVFHSINPPIRIFRQALQEEVPVSVQYKNTTESRVTRGGKLILNKSYGF